MNPSTFRPDNTEDSVGSFSALRTANPSAFRPDRTEDSVGGTFVLLRCEDDEEVDDEDADRPPLDNGRVPLLALPLTCSLLVALLLLLLRAVVAPPFPELAVLRRTLATFSPPWPLRAHHPGQPFQADAWRPAQLDVSRARSRRRWPAARGTSACPQHICAAHVADASR